MVSIARLGYEHIKLCRINEGIYESCFTRRLECSYYTYIVDYITKMQTHAKMLRMSVKVSHLFC